MEHDWQPITFPDLGSFYRCTRCGEEAWDYQGFAAHNNDGCHPATTTTTPTPDPANSGQTGA